MQIYLFLFRAGNIDVNWIHFPSRFQDFPLNPPRRAPLITAVVTGNTTLVQSLLDSGLDISQKVEAYGSLTVIRPLINPDALSVALATGRLDLAELLIQNGANTVTLRQQIRRLASFLAEIGTPGVIPFLIKLRISPDVLKKSIRENMITILAKGHFEFLLQALDLLTGLEVSRYQDSMCLYFSDQIRQEIDFNTETSARTHSPFFFALKSDNPRLVDFMINCGYDVNQQDIQPHIGILSAIHYVMSYGKRRVLDVLLRNNVDVTVKNNDGNTPLHLALSSPTFDQNIIDKLLELGSDVNAFNLKRTTPLYSAFIASHNNLDITKKLISKGALYDIGNHDGARLIHLVLQHDDKVEELRYLISLGVNPYQPKLNFDTPLHLAVKRKNVEYLDILLGLNVDIDRLNEKGETPLQVLYSEYTKQTKKTRIEQIELLSKKRINFLTRDFSGNSLLHSLMKSEHVGRQHIDVFKSLLERGLDINSQNAWNETIAHFYVQGHGSNKLLESLVELGLNLEIQDNKGLTPLQHALEMNDVQKIKILLFIGAKTDTKTNAGQDTIDLLLQRLTSEVRYNKKMVSLFECFIEYGLDFDRRIDASGNTALHFLVKRKTQDALAAVQFVLDNSANPNVQNDEGDTPLHVALLNDNTKVADLLIQQGADLTITNQDEETPFQALQRVRWSK